MTTRKITALATAAALLLILMAGRADATTVRPEVAVVADDDCAQTATVTIHNQAWWVGLDEDALVESSNHPEMIPVGTSIGIHDPLTVTFQLTEDVTIDLQVSWLHQAHKLLPVSIPVDFSEDCTPVSSTTTTAATVPPVVTTGVAPPPSATPVEVEPAFTG